MSYVFLFLNMFMSPPSFTLSLFTTEQIARSFALVVVEPGNNNSPEIEITPISILVLIKKIIKLQSF